MLFLIPSNNLKTWHKVMYHTLVIFRRKISSTYLSTLESPFYFFEQHYLLDNGLVFFLHLMYGSTNVLIQNLDFEFIDVENPNHYKPEKQLHFYLEV